MRESITNWTRPTVLLQRMRRTDKMTDCFTRLIEERDTEFKETLEKEILTYLEPGPALFATVEVNVEIREVEVCYEEEGYGYSITDQDGQDVRLSDDEGCSYDRDRAIEALIEDWETRGARKRDGYVFRWMKTFHRCIPFEDLDFYLSCVGDWPYLIEQMNVEYEVGK